MKYNIHVAQAAERDMANAYDYIDLVLKNPTAADKLLDVADEKIGANRKSAHKSERPDKIFGYENTGKLPFALRVKKPPSGREVARRAGGREPRLCLKPSCLREALSPTACGRSPLPEGAALACYNASTCYCGK